MVVFSDDNTRTSKSIAKQDVRVDTFRASGNGGQHRNKTDSAVRLTHLPTGAVVTAVEDRSQHRNREVAWERLRARLNEASAVEAHSSTNAERQATLDQSRTWTWCGWRDEVKGPGGKRASMTRALSGRIASLIE